MALNRPGGDGSEVKGVRDRQEGNLHGCGLEHLNAYIEESHAGKGKGTAVGSRAASSSLL